MNNDPSKGMSLAEVEQTTGLSREVLRKWELRYRFPQPLRGARDQRVYPIEDVRRLQAITQLMRLGQRPRHLVPLPVDQLASLLTAAQPPVPKAALLAHAELLLQALAPKAPLAQLRQFLEMRIQNRGLAHFVDEDLPLFNAAVGDAWAAGLLSVHAEHRYCETVQSLLHVAIASLRPKMPSRSALLTTPPGELHGLGLLALQATLALQGAHCINLGTQTPIANVVQAAQDWSVAVVALSISSFMPSDAARAYILALRRLLPASCALWVGGGGIPALVDTLDSGVLYVASTPHAVTAWAHLNSQIAA